MLLRWSCGLRSGPAEFSSTIPAGDIRYVYIYIYIYIYTYAERDMYIYIYIRVGFGPRLSLGHASLATPACDLTARPALAKTAEDRMFALRAIRTASSHPHTLMNHLSPAGPPYSTRHPPPKRTNKKSTSVSQQVGYSHIYIYIYIHTHKHIHIHIYIYIYIHREGETEMCIYVYMYIYIYIYRERERYVYVYVCIYIYIYVYTHIYISRYLHITHTYTRI